MGGTTAMERLQICNCRYTGCCTCKCNEILSVRILLVSAQSLLRYTQSTQFKLLRLPLKPSTPRGQSEVLVTQSISRMCANICSEMLRTLVPFCWDLRHTGQTTARGTVHNQWTLQRQVHQVLLQDDCSHNSQLTWAVMVTAGLHCTCGNCHIGSSP
jgi:hypothetical protein